eukprot:TRINITY_DN1078_c1_g2_i2.p1 TRINITY_DN1078_c1_g2~~TRINITY_DN1078_c1_g2_i2.p1  ORF type:complete len:589 (+),score=147.63 TRINITY_DN1078_c1_g2_i2:38-1768(+)
MSMQKKTVTGLVLLCIVIVLWRSEKSRNNLKAEDGIEEGNTPRKTEKTSDTQATHEPTPSPIIPTTAPETPSPIPLHRLTTEEQGRNYSKQLSGPTNLLRMDPTVHRWHLGVCASTAFSSAWLQEWLELMLLSGVGHVWVINDNKPGLDIDTRVILSQYERLGFVTVLYEMPRGHHGCGDYANCIAPKTCYSLAHKYVDRFIFADTDEFIFPRLNCDLSEHVRNHCDSNEAHDVIRWERFGTSGHRTYPQGLMIENFLSSGGDCTAHTASNLECTKRQWDYCLECRHMKSMYSTKCVGPEHLGHVHVAMNTTFFKKYKNVFWKDAVLQPGNESVWHREECKEKTWEDNKDKCRTYSQSGPGSTFPVGKGSKDCCTAGIGYNHYGTKSLDVWNKKMRTKTKRGFKPNDFSVVEQKATISSNVLKFARAMRERHGLLGLPVSKGVSFHDFVDVSGVRRATFVENGYRYDARLPEGSYYKRSTRSTLEDCSEACWAMEDREGSCGGWSFNTVTKVCRRVYGTRASWVKGNDLGALRWPHETFSADRINDEVFISGIPLRGGECPLPDTLRQKASFPVVG